MSCQMLSSQGSATIKDNSTEKCMDLPWFFFFLPAAISPTTSLQLLSIVINWKSELVCSMKPLPGAITLQLSVRNCHPPSRRSKPCRAAANMLLHYRKRDLDKLQLATVLLAAGCSSGDRFFGSSQWSQARQVPYPFFVLYASLQALLA